MLVLSAICCTAASLHQQHHHHAGAQGSQDAVKRVEAAPPCAAGLHELLMQEHGSETSALGLRLLRETLPMSQVTQPCMCWENAMLAEHAKVRHVCAGLQLPAVYITLQEPLVYWVQARQHQSHTQRSSSISLLPRTIQLLGRLPPTTHLHSSSSL